MFTSVYIRKCDVVIDRRIDNIPIDEADEDTYIFSFSDTPILSVNDEVMLGDLKGIFKIVHRELEYPQENEPENCDRFWQNLYVIKVKEDYERWSFEKYKKDELINTKELSVRTKNVLLDNKITTVEQLTKLTHKEFLSFRTAGRKSQIELQQYLLSYHGIEFTF